MASYMECKKRVISVLIEMVETRKIKTQNAICREAGVNAAYFQHNPQMTSLYRLAVQEAEGTPSSFNYEARRVAALRPLTGRVPPNRQISKRIIRLSEDILTRLRSRNLKVKNGAIAEVSSLLGLSVNQSKNWNQTIEWLDSNYPDWRGYPSPYVRDPELVEVIF